MWREYYRGRVDQVTSAREALALAKELSESGFDDLANETQRLRQELACRDEPNWRERLNAVTTAGAAKDLIEEMRESAVLELIPQAESVHAALLHAEEEEERARARVKAAEEERASALREWRTNNRDEIRRFVQQIGDAFALYSLFPKCPAWKAEEELSELIAAKLAFEPAANERLRQVVNELVQARKEYAPYLSARPGTRVEGGSEMARGRYRGAIVGVANLFNLSLERLSLENL